MPEQASGFVEVDLSKLVTGVGWVMSFGWCLEASKGIGAARQLLRMRGQ
jgi:hypothetical protein